MKEEAFAQLVESIKQAGEIKRSLRQPSRVFEVGPLDTLAHCSTNEEGIP